MNENIKLLLQKLADDNELNARMQSITDPDTAYEFAAGIQEGFTKEEFFDAMKALDAAQKGELSDEDLARIAGGESWEEWVSYSVTALAGGAAAVGTIVSGLAAASAAAI